MSNSNVLWPAPVATGPVEATVAIPGSKSMTNRALILSALAPGESVITGALRSRDTNLMVYALRAMGANIRDEPGNLGDQATTLVVTPGDFHGAAVDCGLAGTVMRFVPPVAALGSGTVFFDGDPQAYHRPMGTILNALRSLGVEVRGDSLPFHVDGGHAIGGEVHLDASASSQFISGLLLSAARYKQGITVVHTGDPIPSQPHVDMTIDMLRTAGVEVDTSIPNRWTVKPGVIRPMDWAIEPDLSNATPFLAAAAATGGRVLIPNWPTSTTQPGDQFRDVLAAMGANCEFLVEGSTTHLEVTGPAPDDQGKVHLNGVNMDLHDIGELVPTVAALAALAKTPSQLAGIAHLRGHETDRLRALVDEINGLGGRARETADGLIIEPAQLHGGVWHTYADHRMATAGAIIGLVVEGVEVENIATTAKTFPGFELKWAAALGLAS